MESSDVGGSSHPPPDGYILDQEYGTNVITQLRSKTNDLTTEQCISDETITKTAGTKHLLRKSSTTCKLIQSQYE